jgi:hypothetical protein
MACRPQPNGIYRDTGPSIRGGGDDHTAFCIVRPGGNPGRRPGQPARDRHSAAAPGRGGPRHRGGAGRAKADVAGPHGLAGRPHGRRGLCGGRRPAARLAHRHADDRGHPARCVAAGQRAAPALRRVHGPGGERRDASRLHRDRPAGDPGRPVLPAAPRRDDLPAGAAGRRLLDRARGRGPRRGRDVRAHAGARSQGCGRAVQPRRRDRRAVLARHLAGPAAHDPGRLAAVLRRAAGDAGLPPAQRAESRVSPGG